MYTYKDFITGQTRRTSGKFIGWSKPTGMMNVRYAIFKTPKTTVNVPEYCLTSETRKAIPQPPTDEPLRVQCVRCKHEWPSFQMSDWPQGPLCPECDSIENLIEAEVQAAEQGRLCPDCGHPVPDGCCWYCETHPSADAQAGAGGQ
jgi:hypothetical protein